MVYTFDAIGYDFGKHPKSWLLAAGSAFWRVSAPMRTPPPWSPIA